MRSATLNTQTLLTGMNFSRLILCFSLISIVTIVKAQQDSTFKPFNFSVGIGLSEHTIGDSYYKGFVARAGDEYSSDHIYDTLISKSVIDFSVGYKSSARLFHYISFAFGNETTAFYKSTEMSLHYFTIGYQFNYQFLMKSLFPLKPFAGLNFAYSRKNFLYLIEDDEWPFQQWRYNDRSSLYLIQFVDGIAYQNRFLKLLLYTNFDITGIIKGNYSYNWECPVCNILYPLSEKSSGEYSANIHNNAIQKNLFSFGFRILYTLNQ